MQRPTMNITTDQIQKYLEENKQLIWAILDCRSRGKLSESAQYEDLLQSNLMFLVKIADAQSQTPFLTTPQMMPHEVMPQVRHYMQPTPISPPVDPSQLNLRQIQEQQQWPQQQQLQQQLLIQQQQQQQRLQQQQQQWLQQQRLRHQQRLQQQLLLQQQQQQLLLVQQQQQQQQQHQLPVLPLDLATRPITLNAMPLMHADPTNNQEADGPPSEASALSHSSSGEAGWGSGLNPPGQA